MTNGLGAQAVIVCTASNRAYAQALDFLRFGGTLVCVGMPEGESQPIAKSKPPFPWATPFQRTLNFSLSVSFHPELLDPPDRVD